MKQSHSAIQLREYKTPQSKVRKLEIEPISLSQKSILNSLTSKYKKPPIVKITRNKVPLRNPKFNITALKFSSSPSHVRSLQVSPKNAKGILDNEIFEGNTIESNMIAPVFSSQLNQNFLTPTHKAESYKEGSVAGSVENDQNSIKKELNFRFPGLYKVLKPEKSFEPVFKNLNSSIDSKHKYTSKTTELSFEGNPAIKINKGKSEKSFLNNLEDMYFEELKAVKKETSRLIMPKKSPYANLRDSSVKTPKSRRLSRVPSYIAPNDGSFVLESLKTPYARKLPEIKSPSMKDREAVNRLKEMQAKAEILRTVKQIEEIGTPKRSDKKILINSMIQNKRETISRSLFSAESNLLSLNSSNTKFRFLDESRLFMKKLTK